MAGAVEDMISNLILKGVEKIASRRNITSQDLIVLLLHEQSKSLSRLEKGMGGIANELREFRREMLPLLNQARDIADIKARMERIESKFN